ncbi:unnamed protein product [Parnassius apollo]|uniref:(apollo) hypothetical protein n=1 Tax=Parnassius apollo TaxID=110799 RepID=A0A8S3WDP9_PARAO|nr:unnamed protein product [Parnassius apollo]
MEVHINSINISKSTIEKLVNTLSPNDRSDDLCDEMYSDQINDYSENEDVAGTRSKKRLLRFSESNSDQEDETDKETIKENDNSSPVNVCKGKTSLKNAKSKLFRSRIRLMSVSDSDSELKDMKDKTDFTEKKYDLSRIKNKRKKLKEKFHKLVSPHEKPHVTEVHTDEELNSDFSHSSGKSEEELESCIKIKEKFKHRQKLTMTSICDPDTSDDEEIHTQKQKKSMIKSMKLTSPKPVRISAKQALENMQKIKSESNRMLREKEVSLPYHKPKALSLKDIMNQRKPALAPDGKTLSVKMTSEQLQQYALLLEQRQKEIMELCKSDSEEEECKESQELKDSEINEISNLDNEVNKTLLENTITADTQVMSTSIINTEIRDPNEIGSKSCDSVDNMESGDCTSYALSKFAKDNDFKIHLNNLNEKLKNDEQMENFLGEDKGEQKVNTTDGLEHNLTDVSNVIVCKENTKEGSQMMELHYDSEKTDIINMNENETESKVASDINNQVKEDYKLENDFNFDDIDTIIENTEMKDACKNEVNLLKTKPKLTGTPGMVIDLDRETTISLGNDKKLSGVELLKERFKYFAKLKSLEDQEKDREKKYKPGVQHFKLKQELEEQIAEQRSLEWAKRLEHEKQQQLTNVELDVDEIEKLEAKLEDFDDTIDGKNDSSRSAEEDEEEEEEEDWEFEDKPRKRNPMLDDEAEESDIENYNEVQEIQNDTKKEANSKEENEEFDASDEDSSEEESSESDDEDKKSKPKKGRILKAFEDSDDDEIVDNSSNHTTHDLLINNSQTSLQFLNENTNKSLNISGTQDEELQLAQVHKSASEEVVVSQVSASDNNLEAKDLKSQTFSIINSENDIGLTCLNKLVVKESKCVEDTDADLSLENISQSSQQKADNMSESQEIGDDVLALCTGKFYDNPFVSQVDVNSQNDDIHLSMDTISPNENMDNIKIVSDEKNDNTVSEEKNILSSILEELDNPEPESPKQYKYFVNDNTDGNKENKQNVANSVTKKKFIIDSDDDVNEKDVSEKQSKKKSKKRKLENRALQFSDDEEDDEEDAEASVSDLEENPERIVEYDSEENEIEVLPQSKTKKKRVAGDFFEQEAELTSEDEWVGSGDEDEAGLDRMEREEGDDEVFHEGKLRKELGQIHMRDVLDQDKREVRLLQELLFEDGDLGDGHRQRKFRWRNADDVEELDAPFDEITETPEEEFESEEQWRKQRHEREVFLRKMKGIDEEDVQNVSINRTTIIKANLCSRTMSSIISETNTSLSEKIEKNVVVEKKTYRDVPSPKKPFTLFQQNYHGSLLSRGKGALARLAAIATPLAGDSDDAPKVSAPTNRRNFVFASLTPDDVEPKVSKRKADINEVSPALIKKMKTEEKHNNLRSSLFDYLDV